MGVIKRPRHMQQLAARWRRQGLRIGFVPTMGALHEGHLSLIRRAARENDRVIVSIFVNPLQFGPREDFTRYPRPFARDAAMARRAGAAVIFAPAAAALYPPGFQTHIDVGALAERWEGQARPGHFRGVATVVHLLFALTQPTVAYFGQKDYQQVCVIRQVVRDWQLPVALRMCPTVRERDGLAMSSRNAYLSPSQRRAAVGLSHALRAARRAIGQGERSAARVTRQMRRVLAAHPGVRVAYAAVTDAATLAPLRRLQGPCALLLAVHVGKTRLIDNLLVDVS